MSVINHQHPALTRVNSLEQPVEYAALGVAVNQLHRAPAPVKSAAICTAVALTLPGDRGADGRCDGWRARRRG